MSRSVTVRLFCTSILFCAALLAAVPARSAAKAVDLDGNPANGAESTCELNVLQTFPVQIQTKITNRAVGDSYTFSWPSAGPGGFRSSLTPGSTGGVGAIWTWTTNQSVVSFSGGTCDRDICFNSTGGPDATASYCSNACAADGTTINLAKGAAAGTVVLNWTGGTAGFTVYRSTNSVGLTVGANIVGSTALTTFTDTPPATDAVSFYLVRGTDCAARKACTSDADCGAPGDGSCFNRGPFGVPGRSLLANDVTVSAASLTASLITFFSPPKEVFRITSSTNSGSFSETVSNTGTQPVTYQTPAYPPGCCPANPDVPHQLRCGAVCVDYLNDPYNCGACGNVCGDGTCCTDGQCASVCAAGLTYCNGECADFQNDNNNCGACGNVCGEGTCCNEGACESICPAGQIYCNGKCVDTQNDNANCGGCGNACGDGTCCNEGACASICAAGQTYCNGECADFQNDSNNCGSCGNVCGEGTCCNGGVCASECPAGRIYCNGQCYDPLDDPGNCGGCGINCGPLGICVAGTCEPCSGAGGAKNSCDNTCVNLNTDPYNCGGCGVSCNTGCPSNFHGVCSNGQSCRCVNGPPAPPPPPNIPPPIPAVCPNPNPSAGPVPGVCPNTHPTFPIDGVCPNPHPSAGPVPGVCPVLTDPPPPESETCIVTNTVATIPPGGSSTVCTPGGVLYKEVPTAITICGDGIPGVDGVCNNSTGKVTIGTYNRLLPDTSKVVGDAFLTPYAIHIVSDTSNDGLLQPGESASLIIDLLNAGPKVISNATATLQAPAVDLSDDGVANPVGIAIGTPTSSYGTIYGTSPSTACLPGSLQIASNTPAFPITVPASHPEDSSHPMVLGVSGTVDGHPFSMDVPVSLGIADRCDVSSGLRGYDGLDGLVSPMAKLVPLGDPIPMPSKAFSAGNTRPMKLRVLCGGVNLTDSMVDPPQIVGLSELSRGELDIHALNLNSDNGSNPNDPDFRFNNTTLQGGSQWIYNMRTSLIGTGTFTVRIKIGGRKVYVAGFVLQ